MSNKKFFVGFVLWIAAIIVTVMVMTNCSRHPHDPTDPDHPHDSVPPDTVVVVDTLIIIEVDTVFMICDRVDLTIEFTVIKDQSQPNVYAYFVNGVEVGRFIITETASPPIEVTFVVTFPGVTFGDVITIKKIEGSRAEAIGSSIVGIECSQ